MSKYSTKNQFSVTFEIVTHESAEHGEAEEIGYVDEKLSLRDALALVDGQVSCADSSHLSLSNPPRWFSVEYDNNFCTGEIENRSLHLPRTISAHSALRIARLLGIPTQ